MPPLLGETAAIDGYAVRYTDGLLMNVDLSLFGNRVPMGVPRFLG